MIAPGTFPYTFRRPRTLQPRASKVLNRFSELHIFLIDLAHTRDGLDVVRMRQDASIAIALVTIWAWACMDTVRGMKTIPQRSSGRESAARKEGCLCNLRACAAQLMYHDTPALLCRDVDCIGKG